MEMNVLKAAFNEPYFINVRSGHTVDISIQIESGPQAFL